MGESAGIRTGGCTGKSAYALAIGTADGQVGGLVCAKAGRQYVDERADGRAVRHADGGLEAG